MPKERMGYRKIALGFRLSDPPGQICTDSFTEVGISFGFILDSNVFTVTFTAKREHKILSLCQASLDNHCQRMLPLALFYRQLERCKITTLRQHKGDYKKNVIITEGALADVHWWASSLHSASLFIHPTSEINPL